MLRIQNFSKRFNQNLIFENVSLTFSSRGLYFITGQSGSGKSTLLNILQGKDPDYEGNITINDHNLRELSLDRFHYYFNEMSTIYQDFRLLSGYTVLENLYSVTKVFPESKTNILEILKLVDVYELRNVKVDHLSGGEKQRIAIARSLLINPNILLLDEPTGSLDEENARSIIRLIREIAKTRLVLCVTHDTSLIEENDLQYCIEEKNIFSKKPILIENENRIKSEIHHLKQNGVFYFSFLNIKAFFGRILLMTLLIGFGLGMFISSFFMTGFMRDSLKEFTEKNSNLKYVYIDQKNIDSFLKIKENELFENFYYTLDYTKSILKKDHRVELNRKKHLPLAEISLLTGKFPNENEIILSPTMAKKLYKKSFEIIGEEIEIEILLNEKDKISKKLEVVGIFNHEYDNYILSTTLEREISELYTSELKTGINLQLNDYDQLLKSYSELDTHGIKYTSAKEEVERLNQTFENFGIIYQVISIVLLIVLFIITILLYLKYFQLKKNFKRVFESIGYNQSMLLKMKISEGILLFCCSAVTTVLFSFGFVWITDVILKTFIS